MTTNATTWPPDRTAPRFDGSLRILGRDFAMPRAAGQAQNLLPGSALQRHMIATRAYPSGGS